MKPSLKTALLLNCLAVIPAFAADPWALCPLPAESSVQKHQGTGMVRLDADEILAREKGKTQLKGNVVVQRDQTTLHSDSAEYDKTHKSLQLKGNVSYRTPQLRIDSEQAQLELNQNRGEFENANFIFRDAHGSGSAKRLEVRDRDLARMLDLNYTTCNPKDPAWQ